MKKCCKCAIYRDNECSLDLSPRFFCSFFQKRIKGIESIKEYIEIVMCKQNSNRTLTFAIIAMIISFLSMIVAFLRWVFPLS